VAVLTAVRVSISDHVVVVVIDAEMIINLVGLVNSIIDTVLICAEDRRIVFIAVFNNVFVYVFEILTNEEPNSSLSDLISIKTGRLMHSIFIRIARASNRKPSAR
jgi:hypothetical protein